MTLAFDQTPAKSGYRTIALNSAVWFSRAEHWILRPRYVRLGQLSKPLWKEFLHYLSRTLSRVHVSVAASVPGVVEIVGLGSPRK